MSLDSNSPGAVAPGAAPSRTVWLIAGILGAASLAAGAGMLVRNGLPAPAGQAVPAKEAAAPAGKRVVMAGSGDGLVWKCELLAATGAEITEPVTSSASRMSTINSMPEALLSTSM